jgi:hypothetical protein
MMNIHIYDWKKDPDKQLPEYYPEKVDELRQSRTRILKATELYEENFTLDGKPKTKKGRALSKKYEAGEHRAPRLLVWKIKIKRKIRILINFVFPKGNRE